MKENQIQTYLRKLELHLWIRGLADKNDLAEIESHLLEAVERGLDQELSLEEAETRALERFGSHSTISTCLMISVCFWCCSFRLSARMVDGLFDWEFARHFIQHNRKLISS